MKNIEIGSLSFGKYISVIYKRDRVYGVDMKCMTDWVVTEPPVERINDK